MKPYGTHTLTDTSPVQIFTEPLTLAQVKKNLELPERSPTDPDEDEDLTSMIIAARTVSEAISGYQLVAKQWDLAHDSFLHAQQRCLGRNSLVECCYQEIVLSKQPVVSVDLVRYRDSGGVTHDLVEGTDYVVDVARGVILPAYGQSWPSYTPWPSSSVLIRYTAGFTPEHAFWRSQGHRVRKAMKSLINHWFVHRLPFDTIPGQTFGEFPYDVTALLNFGSNKRVH